jgi:uncharacterized protein YbjT (DUF2867 family)
MFKKVFKSNKDTAGGKDDPNRRKVIVLMADHGLVGKAILPGLLERKLLDVYAGVSDPHHFQMEGVTPLKIDVEDTKGIHKVFKAKKFDRVILVVPANRTDWAENVLEAADFNKYVKFVLLVSLVLAPLNETFFGGNYKEMEKAAKHFFPFGHCIVRLPLLYDATIPLCAPTIKASKSYTDPRDPSMPFRCIALSDVAKAITQIIIRPGNHECKTYNLVGPSLTLNQQTDALSKALKKDIKLESEEYEEYEAMLTEARVPHWSINGTLEIYKLIDEGCEVTNLRDGGDYEKITGEKPLTFEKWVSLNRDQFLK